MPSAVKGLWNIVLSGYPRSGKTTLAKRLVADHPSFARIGVDELRDMLFNEIYPCRDEFLVYSIISDMRDALLSKGYSVIIDSTAPDNVTRQFLLTTKAKRINELLIIVTTERNTLATRNIETFGDTHPIIAYDKRWENPKKNIPLFKFKSTNTQEFENYYSRLEELLESEVHPFKPEFRHPRLPITQIRRTLKRFLEIHSLTKPS
jgi:predicted kinase